MSGSYERPLSATAKLLEIHNELLQLPEFAPLNVAPKMFGHNRPSKHSKLAATLQRIYADRGRRASFLMSYENPVDYEAGLLFEALFMDAMKKLAVGVYKLVEELDFGWVQFKIVRVPSSWELSLEATAEEHLEFLELEVFTLAVAVGLELEITLEPDFNEVNNLIGGWLP